MTIVISSIKFYELNIPFKQIFKHSSATRSETETAWIEVRSECGALGYGEGCPRSYVTGENMCSASEFFSSHKEKIKQCIHGLSDLKKWVETHQEDIDQNPAAWCALELAILDTLAKSENRSIENLLDLPELDGKFQYTAIMGDSSPESFQHLLTQYYSQGFRDFKVKLSGELSHDQKKLKHIVELNDEKIIIRVDANNLWSGAKEAINYIQALPCNIWAIEEPLINKSYREMALISQSLNCFIILDESFLRYIHFDELNNSPSQWIINLRISKMGGLLRSLNITSQAAKWNIPIITGAQVGETSLLTRAALTITAKFNRCIIAREGGFGTLLLQNDICNPSLMINNTGEIVWAFESTKSSGFSIDIKLNDTDLKLVDSI